MQIHNPEALPWQKSDLVVRKTNGLIGEIGGNPWAEEFPNNWGVLYYVHYFARLPENLYYAPDFDKDKNFFPPGHLVANGEPLYQIWEYGKNLNRAGADQREWWAEKVLPVRREQEERLKSFECHSYKDMAALTKRAGGMFAKTM